MKSSEKVVGVIIDEPTSTSRTKKLTFVPPPHRDWTAGICYCCKVPDWGCYACFCYFCVLNQLTKGLNEAVCLPCLPWCGLLAMRMKMRMLYGIKGDSCHDCCQLCFCNGCVACQMHHEGVQIGIIEPKTCSMACKNCCVCFV